jgi:hypothetical protein
MLTMKLNLLTLILFSCTILLIQSCKYDKAWELMPGTEPCDTIAVTFSGQIQSILLHNCMDCHSTENETAGVVLDTYEGAKFVAEDGRLIAVINHESGVPPMPKDASKLDPCTIRIIEIWVEDGALDN